MQKNEFIRISYGGKIKESGQQFDSAENAPVIVGAEFVIPGLDEVLKQMQVGEKRTVEISPEDGFGQRDPKLIKLIPESEFKKHDTKPYPGMFVSADKLQGRVLSVSSGRVRVDFNHPLAGKVLIYDLEIKERIENTEDKIKAVVEFYTKLDKKKINTKINNKEVEIELPPVVHGIAKKKIADDIIKYVELERVKFSEIFERPKKEAEKTKSD